MGGSLSLHSERFALTGAHPLDAEKLSDTRTPYQRDRDRVLYTHEFRRLGGVTQITTPSELLIFHNRLTHTLEVAQIARRLAERLNVHAEVPDRDQADVVEAAALAHDLGHPPFGHNGEIAFNEFLKSQPRIETAFELSDGFEGNAQSFRIVTKKARRTSENPGLELTRRTLMGILKYPWSRRAMPTKYKPEHPKFNVYETERDAFDFCYGEDAFDHRQPKSIDAQIMDWADDLAYSTHDIADFALLGFIPFHHFRSLETIEEVRELLGDSKFAEGFENVAIGVFKDMSIRLNTYRVNSLSPSGPEVGLVRSWVSDQLRQFIDGTSINEKGELSVTPEVNQRVAILKRLTWHYTIESPILSVRSVAQKRIIRDLCEIVFNNALGKGDLLSPDAREQLASGNLRVPLDVLSSMTDHQATNLHHKLTGIQPISILDKTSIASF